MPLINEEIRGELEALLRLARDEGLSELAVDRPGFRLLAKRGQAPAAAPSRPPAPTGQKQAAAPKRRKARPPRPSIWQICSPLTGLFYRSPSPEQRPFVEVGDLVEEGQTVCLVEAMKVFNEIPAERRGRVVEILAEKGELVEDGQVLVVLELE